MPGTAERALYPVIGTSTEALAERVLGNALFYRGETVDGLAWMDRMVELAENSRDDSLLAHACYMRSVAHTSVGSPTALAQGRLRRRAVLVLQTRRPGPDTRAVRPAGGWSAPWTTAGCQAFARTEELNLRAQRGDIKQALTGYREVVDMWFRGGEWANQWLALRHLFGVSASLGDDEIAAVLYGALDAAGATTALPSSPRDRPGERTGRHRPRLLRPAAFEAAVNRGRTMRDEATKK